MKLETSDVVEIAKAIAKDLNSQEVKSAKEKMSKLNTLQGVYVFWVLRNYLPDKGNVRDNLEFQLAISCFDSMNEDEVLLPNELNHFVANVAQTCHDYDIGAYSDGGIDGAISHIQSEAESLYEKLTGKEIEYEKLFDSEEK